MDDIIFSNGYYLKEINFDQGIFDNSVDCTYIIHYVKNDRLISVFNELNKIKPTKKCFILFNEGYKEGNKLNKNINSPSSDIGDAYLFIFQHSLKNYFNNILIHEDDFFYDDKILNLEVQTNINEFMNININKKIFYNLGAVALFKKIDKNHNKILICMSSHAIIYTKKAISHLLNNLDISTLIDLYMQKIIEDKYTYKYPLCYQTIEITENLNDWTNINNILYRNKKMYNINLTHLNNYENIFLSDILKNTIKSLNLGEKKNAMIFYNLIYNMQNSLINTV